MSGWLARPPGSKNSNTHHLSCLKGHPIFLCLWAGMEFDSVQAQPVISKVRGQLSASEAWRRLLHFNFPNNDTWIRGKTKLFLLLKQLREKAANQSHTQRVVSVNSIPSTCSFGGSLCMASRVSLTTKFYRFTIDWIIRIISQIWGHRSCDCLVLGPWGN